MRLRPVAGPAIPLALTLTFLTACGKTTPPAPVAPKVAKSPAARPAPVEVKNEIPAGQLDAVIRDHFLGLGFMEQYEYAKAAKEFRDARERAPGWIPGSINLAIALLNDVGAAAEANKGGGNAGGSYGEPLALLDDVLLRDPKSITAHYCRGLILEVEGRLQEANDEFKRVTELDPLDGHAWYRLGATLPSSDDPNRQANVKDAPRLIELYTKALERNPYLVSAMYRLQQAYSFAANSEKDKEGRELLLRKSKEVRDLWLRLDPKKLPTAPGDTSEAFYGEAGRYSKVVNPFPRDSAPVVASPPPQFDELTPIKVTLPEGSRWVNADDFTGPLAVIGRAQARFGATVTTFDADGDGRADVFLAAAVKGPKGVRDALLLNKADGVFEDASAAWGLPDDRASLGAAAADFDADRKVDLFLTGLDDNHLLRNAGPKFEDITAKVGIAGSKALAITARWMDLDQDGDLDLYVVNHTERVRVDDAFKTGNASPLPKVSNSAYRNDGKPSGDSHRPENNWAPLAVAPPDLKATAGLSLSLTLWPGAETPHGPLANYTAIAALYLDDDRDLDLVLAADGDPPRAVLNDRLGRFHVVDLKDLASAEPIDGLLVSDFDKDGRADLAAVRSAGRVSAWRNATDEKTPLDSIAWQPWPTDAKNWRNATANDLDLDTWPDVVGLPARGQSPAVDWARNDGKRLADRAIPVGPGLTEMTKLNGFALADLAGDALPDLLVVSDDSPPKLARNLGNGEHWLAIVLGGRWKTSFDHMRTNPHGFGTRITVEGQGLHVTYDDTTSAAGLGQSLGPIVLGLGKSQSADLVRFRWPDGTVQCEMEEKADIKLPIAEYNRKKGSCPVLFTWNGTKFVCLGDFLGGGGLGYLVAPGIYGQPDPDESVAIAVDQLKPERGAFRLVVTEPMDEVAYLDELKLVAIDRPPGVSVGLDERFAPEGPRPTGQTVAWSTAIRPVRAADLKGRDITKTLSAWDRDTADDFRLLSGWIGYAEGHGIVLDFGDRLAKYRADDPLVLALVGWVEYPYSQTNYAASTAGVSLNPPTIERLQADGSWKMVEPHAGYPAGMPRLTTLDLTGKLTGPTCVIRLKTNMECYWDQAFVALRDKPAEAALRRTTLPVARAVLEHRGYTREVSPDGKPPLIYDYDYVDPTPMAMMKGKLTRLGDVAKLLQSVDDQVCVVGPGDEARIEFDGEKLPVLSQGWTRSYVLESYGYCKDADPFTALSDSVEPLPWRGMPAFPFATDVHRPTDPAYRAYLDTYQTRPAGSR